jgi:WD40 repeat protein
VSALSLDILRPISFNEGVFQMLEDHSNLVNSVTFSHDGKQVVSGSWDEMVQL